VATALEPALPWLVGLWAMGVGLLSGKLILGGWSVHRLKLAQTTPVTSEWLERLQTLRHRMRVSRPVRLLESALVEVPTVAGWFRPVILLPVSTLSGLSMAQLELILAHELAHIRRCDAWINLLQVLVETLLFYHPAVWWVSRCIREERELCCDDLAVQACGNRLAYAQALTALESLRGPAATTALAASGGSLLQRIRHVLGLPGTPLALGWRRRTGNTLVGVGAGLFVLGIVWLAMSPKQYEAVARVVVRRGDGAPLALGAAGGDVSDPYQVLTEAGRPQTSAVLTEVVARLNLAPWADPGEATPLAAQQAVARLRKRIHTRVVENTDLVEIRVCSSASDKPAEEAAEIANKIAEVYVESRSRLDQELTARGIEAVELMLGQQNAAVANTQAKADELRKILDISESDVFPTTPRADFVTAPEIDDADKTEQARPYFVAKRDLENQQKIRDAILLRWLNETVNANIPRLTVAELVDPATPPINGRYPGHRAGLGLCGLGALCCLLGLLLRLPTPSAPAGS